MRHLYRRGIWNNALEMTPKKCKRGTNSFPCDGSQNHKTYSVKQLNGYKLPSRAEEINKGSAEYTYKLTYLSDDRIRGTAQVWNKVIYVCWCTYRFVTDIWHMSHNSKRSLSLKSFRQITCTYTFRRLSYLHFHKTYSREYQHCRVKSNSVVF